MIELKKLTVCQRRKVILNIDRLTIPEKGIFLLLGDNGTGKTTLIRSILRIHEDFAGDITIDGKNNRELSRIEIAKKISYLPQISNVEPDMNAEDFIRQGLYATGAGDFDSVADSLKLYPYLEKNYRELSGGQKQLCRIARALIADVGYTFLDEPDSYLSRKNKKHFFEAAEKYSKNRCLLMISHDGHLPYEKILELWEDE